MGIDRKKFMTLAFSMWSGAAVLGCGPPPPAAAPPPPPKEAQPMQAHPGGTLPTQQEQCVEFSAAGECVEWNVPAEPTGECVNWNAADECIEWSDAGDEGPTDECMEWDSTDECIRFASPAEECVEWDATDECIRWE